MGQLLEGGRPGLERWRSWTFEVRVWKLAVAIFCASILVFWFEVVHQDDEILALVRNDVAADPSGRRSWWGSFVNTNDVPLRDVVVTVDFLDGEARRVARASASAAEIAFGAHLELRAPLPAEASQLRIYSVQWRRGRDVALLGPFREPWPFGYVMADPAIFAGERGGPVP